MKKEKYSSEWSQEEISLLEHLRPYMTITQVHEEFIAKGYHRSRKAIERKACNLGIFYKGGKQQNQANAIDMKYSQAWQKILALKQSYKEDYEYRRIGVMDPKKSTRKILCIGDFHIPFDRDDLIYNIIQKHHNADILVVNGDMLDLHAVSTWPKERSVVLRKEYEIAMEYLKVFSKTFPHVVLIRGNHEYRLNRYFHSNVSKSVSFLVNKEILGRLANGEVYDNDGNIIEQYDFSNVYYDNGPEAWFAKIGKTMFIHPQAFSRVEAKTAINAQEYFMERSDIDCIVTAHCFDEETEILTEGGWHTIDTIQKTDRPITAKMIQQTGQGSKNYRYELSYLESDNINSIHVYDDYKELIHFTTQGNKGSFDILVTPQHGMLGRSPTNANTWLKKSAEEFERASKFRIPVTAEINPSLPDYNISDTHLQILAWVFTEGNIEKLSDNTYHARIYQSEDKNMYTEEIDQALQSIELEYTKTLRYEKWTKKHGVYRNYDAYRYSISMGSSQWIFEYMNTDKTFKWEFLNTLSLRQRKLIINTLLKGDGSKCGSPRWRAFYQKHKVRADQFQMLATTAGIRTRMFQRKDGTNVVTLSQQNFRTITKTERVRYKGRVWCLNVGNGTLVARRNGVVFITQNTHQLACVPSRNKLCLEQGCLCCPLDYQKQGKLRYKAMGLGYVLVYQDTEGNCDFNKTHFVYLGTQYSIKKSIDDLLI